MTQPHDASFADFAEAMNVELLRHYFTAFDRVAFGADSPEVTDDEVREIVAKMRAEEQADNTWNGLVTATPYVEPPVDAAAYLANLNDILRKLGPPRERMRIRMSSADSEALKAGSLVLDDETLALVQLHGTIPEGIPAHMRPLFGLDVILDDDCPRPVIEPMPQRKASDDE